MNVQVLSCTNNFITSLILNDLVNTPWLLTIVYGPTNSVLKLSFWEDIQRLGDTFNGPWCVGGDFNAILDQKDKLGGRIFSSGSMCRFTKCVDDGGLIDLGFMGYPYTWSNQRAGKANIQERLDRFFGNADWRHNFPHASVQHLIATCSDHKLILLLTNPILPSRPKPFRFEGMWVREPSSSGIIEQAWKKGTKSSTISQIMTNIKYTKLVLKS